MTDVVGILQFLEIASPEVKAELFGNAVLLVTGLLGLVLTAVVTLVQLRSQREEAARDRALELKREVLLEAVRGAYEIQLAINALSTDIPLDAISDRYKTATSKLVAASAVASIETVTSGQTLLRSAAPTFMGLMVQRGPIELAMADFNISSSLVDKQISANQITVDLQRRAITEGEESAADILGNFFELGRKSFEDLALERDKNWKRLLELRRIYIPVVLRAQADLDAPFRDLIASIRVDVGIDKTKEEFLRATAMDSAYFEGLLDNMDAALDTMERNIESQDNQNNPDAR